MYGTRNSEKKSASLRQFTAFCKSLHQLSDYIITMGTWIMVTISVLGQARYSYPGLLHSHSSKRVRQFVFYLELARFSIFRFLKNEGRTIYYSIWIENNLTGFVSLSKNQKFKGCDLRLYAKSSKLNRTQGTAPFENKNKLFMSAWLLRFI